MRKENVDLLFAAQAGDLAVVDELLASQAYSIATLNNAFRVSCLANNIEVAELILDQGAEVEDYLLTIAAMKNQTPLILFLLRRGADVKHKEYLCVRKALEIGNIDAVNAMIESKFVD